MADEFTYAAYRTLLADLLERGYEAAVLEDVDPGTKTLILRHDLDMSLQAAEPVAEIEHELGIRASYFVLLRTEMYNLFSARARASLERLLSLGHEIGLHLDASLYGNDPAEIEQAAAAECAALEEATGSSVRFISFHRPARSLLGYDKPIAGRRHAYEPCFFNDIGYVSDSRGGWYHGHPLKHKAVAKGHALQLLTHPIWWTREPGSDPLKTLENFVAARHSLLRHELAENCEPYREAIGEDKKNDQ